MKIAKKSVILAIGFASLLAACQGDDILVVSPQTLDAVQIKAVYKITVSPFMINNTLPVVHYIDEEGNVVQDTLRKTAWTQSVNLPLPAKVGFSFQPSVKDELTTDQYNIHLKASLQCMILDRNGRRVGDIHLTEMPNVDAFPTCELLEQYIDSLSNYYHVAKTIDFEGHVDSLSFEWTKKE